MPGVRATSFCDFQYYSYLLIVLKIEPEVFYGGILSGFSVLFKNVRRRQIGWMFSLWKD